MIIYLLFVIIRYGDIMKIIIVGIGKLGEYLAKNLVKEKSNLPSDKTVDFIISASPSETYKISSINGYSKEIKASDDGVLKINNLSPGEYRILSQTKKNP